MPKIILESLDLENAERRLCLEALREGGNIVNAAEPLYSVKEYNGNGSANFEASPAATGFVRSGVDYPNPGGCHVFQQLILVQSPAEHPRSQGNPHFNPGQSNPPALNGTALATASTIDVAPVANYPAIHIGCVGWNVLKDPIVWIR